MSESQALNGEAESKPLAEQLLAAAASAPAPAAQAPAPPAQTALPTHAFDAPQLIMSTNRVLRSRRFTVLLTMGTAMASRFTEFDVMRAGLSAKVRREDDLNTNITSCFCSGGKRVIEIGISSKASFGPTISTDGLVTYTFDNCRSNCSSSRDHHKSRLMLVIDDLPGHPLVISSSFVLQAREKQVRSRNSGKHAAADPASPDEQQLQQPQGSAAPAVAGADGAAPSAKRARASAMMALVACADEQQQQRGSVASAAASAAASLLSSPSLPLGKLLAAPPTLMLPKMMVRVHTTAITAPAVDTLLETFAMRLRRLNGYCGYRWRALPGFAVTFSIFQDSEGALNSLAIAKNFMHTPEENPYHCDLADTSILCLISYCTNW